MKITLWQYTCIFLLLCLILPNNKAFFVLSAMYVLIIFWRIRSWEKVVVYGYWPMALYYVGQLYVINVISAEELKHPLYPDGRSLYFKFTPLLIFCLAIIFSWLIKIAVEKIRVNWIIVVLLVGVLLRLISSFGYGGTPWWMQMGNFATELAGMVWLWWTINYLYFATLSEKTEFWRFIERFFKLVLILSAVLIICQGIKGSGLGLIVEQSEVLPYSEAGGDSGGWLSRPIGWWSHANLAAFYTFSYLSAWILIKVKSGQRIEIRREKWMILPLMSLIWLQSRSVYLALIPILIWWVFFYGKEWRRLALSYKFEGLKKWMIVGVMFVLILVVSGRFWNSVTNFGEGSGWNTRERLNAVAVRIWMGHFWFGVGENNFIPVAFREDMSGAMKYFPESVHNGWLLILTEQGILGLSSWGLFLGILLVTWWKRTSKYLALRWLLVAIILGQSMVMIFQPFITILSEGVLLSVILLSDEREEG